MSGRRYALFGERIDRSPSPAMQQAAFEHYGLNARYELRPTSIAKLDEALDELTCGQWAGANVTYPLKQHAAARVTARGHAVRAGAVNTILRDDDGELYGELTDVEGVQEPLDAAGFAGGDVLILGAGGAARAAALAVTEGFGAIVHLAVRDIAKGRAMIEQLALTGDCQVLALDDTTGLERLLPSIDLLVQATPVGFSGDSIALPWGAVSERAMAFELLYLPRRTPFLQQAAARGCKTLEGWQMLVAQGAHAFTLWTGRPAPREAMRAAVLGQLSACE